MSADNGLYINIVRIGALVAGMFGTDTCGYTMTRMAHYLSTAHFVIFIVFEYEHV